MEYFEHLLCTRFCSKNFSNFIDEIITTTLWNRYCVCLLSSKANLSPSIVPGPPLPESSEELLEPYSPILVSTKGWKPLYYTTLPLQCYAGDSYVNLTLKSCMEIKFLKIQTHFNTVEYNAFQIHIECWLRSIIF